MFMVNPLLPDNPDTELNCLLLADNFTHVHSLWLREWRADQSTTVVIGLITWLYITK